MAPKKTKKKNTTIKNCDRLTFLGLLKEEFTNSKSLEAKKQTLANLANFAYDPINYEHLRKINAIDLFLRLLDSSNEDFVHYALAGLCNLSCDEENREYINSFEGSFGGIKACLKSSRIETVLNAITTLLFLNTPSSKCRIMDEDTIATVRSLCRSADMRLLNLANIFLNDT